jgi:hypothetical protein
MTLPNNIVQNVQTYNEAELALLQNNNAFIATANTKYRDFQKANPANLGDTITFDKPPRFVANDGLEVNFQGVEQRVQSLVVDQAKNIGLNISAQQLIFNLDDYMDRFGRSAVAELGAVIESDVATVCETSPYRFFGNGVTPINSFNQLAQALAFFRNFGAAHFATKGYLSDIAIPDIIGAGLNQFVPGGNEELRNSWDLGAFAKCDWYSSNLLPTHIAGTEGQAGTTLTVVSVTTNSDGGVISITFSGTTAANDADSIKAYDRFQFQDNVSGQPNIRFRTFVGHKPSACPVQFKATANAGSTAGSQVTVTIDPPLQATTGKNQNVTEQIQAGMQVKVLPSHRVGMIQSGNQFYVAIPPLPDCDPYTTSVMTDPDTGVSLRKYTGAGFGTNLYGTVNDAIWGKTQVSDNGMAMIFPL